ncbi:MAG TPA: threonine dehydratase [Stellaceae bacterium]|nr:threonine dehydratase [Stellaceae bacterium]
MMTSLARLDEAAALVRAVVPATPQYCWPLLSRRTGAELWVKHENHTPIGAFKLRGGLIYLDELRRTQPNVRGVITATRGNHGQSIAYAAARLGLAATVVVPHGNSIEKNRAMEAFGATLVEAGHDFQAAYEYASARATTDGLHLVRSFDPALVRGVASCGLELFRAVQGLDTVYVPIGLGSGICAMIAARDALGETAEIVGVVAANAPAYALSLAAGRPVSTNSSDTIADGLAVRVPDTDALAIIANGAARIVSVSEAEIRQAMRILFTDTHNVAEGAGAAPLAAALQERARLAGRRVAVVQSGGNIDRALLVEVLAEGDAE